MEVGAKANLLDVARAVCHPPLLTAAVLATLFVLWGIPCRPRLIDTVWRKLQRASSTVLVLTTPCCVYFAPHEGRGAGAELCRRVRKLTFLMLRVRFASLLFLLLLC